MHPLFTVLKDLYPQSFYSRQSAGGNEIPQMFCGVSSPTPNSKGRSRLANTTRAVADFPVSCTWTLIRAPSSSWLDVLTKAPCRFTTMVSPSHDNPVVWTSMRTRMRTRVLRRRSLRRSAFPIHVAGLIAEMSRVVVGLVSDVLISQGLIAESHPVPHLRIFRTTPIRRARRPILAYLRLFRM